MALGGCVNGSKSANGVVRALDAFQDRVGFWAQYWRAIHRLQRECTGCVAATVLVPIQFLQRQIPLGSTDFSHLRTRATAHGTTGKGVGKLPLRSFRQLTATQNNSAVSPEMEIVDLPECMALFTGSASIETVLRIEKVNPT